MAHILVCDDDAGVRDVLCLTLELDHDVTAVASGVQALEYLAEIEGRVDVLLLDVMMPELDGFDTLRRIRQSAVTADLPVVLLTARVAEGDYVAGYEAGADAYLSKPCDAGAINEAVTALLARTPDERRAVREDEQGRARLLWQLEHRFG